MTLLGAKRKQRAAADDVAAGGPGHRGAANTSVQ